MDESKNLLACPFCGGEVEHYYSGSSDWEFECKTQGCNAQVTFWVRGGDEPERARQLWNRRAGGLAHGATDGSRLGAVSGSAAELRARIQSYFGNGGLFNPEMMEHDKVRDLLLDLREYIDRTQPPNAKLTDAGGEPEQES